MNVTVRRARCFLQSNAANKSWSQRGGRALTANMSTQHPVITLAWQCRLHNRGPAHFWFHCTDNKGISLLDNTHHTTAPRLWDWTLGHRGMHDRDPLQTPSFQEGTVAPFTEKWNGAPFWESTVSVFHLLLWWWDQHPQTFFDDMTTTATRMLLPPSKEVSFNFITVLTSSKWAIMQLLLPGGNKVP